VALKRDILKQIGVVMKNITGIFLALFLYLVAIFFSLIGSIVTIGVANELYLKFFDFKIF
jgi:hypothetical protein